MYSLSIVFTLLTMFFLSALSAPLPVDRSLGKRNTGRGTWYYDGLGACGITNTNTQAIVAVSQLIYASGVYCGRYVQITNTANQETAYGLVEDECQSCGADDLDMSEGLFEQIGQLSTGVLTIDWDFMPVGWVP